MKRFLVALGVLGVLAMGGLYVFASAVSTIEEGESTVMDDRVNVYVDPRPVVVLENPGDEVSFEVTVRIGPALQAGKATADPGVVTKRGFNTPVGFDGRVTVSIVDAVTGDEALAFDLEECVGGCVRTLIWTLTWSEGIERGLPVGESLEMRVDIGARYLTPEPYFPHEYDFDPEDLSVEAVLIEDNGS